MNAPGTEHALSVCLVARNVATIGDLRAYLEGAGVTCRVVRGPCRHRASDSAVVVVFPDDHPEPTRAAVVERLVQAHRIAVVVTCDPQRYRAAAGERGRRGDRAAAVILPRPAFGWEILDALRGRVGGPAGSPW